MKSVENLVAEKLLKVKAIKVQPSNPFTWASGWKSPIYCDNRKTLSYPDVRTLIKIEIARIIRETYDDVDVVAGVATGAIAQGAMVADELGFNYYDKEIIDHVSVETGFCKDYIKPILSYKDTAHLSREERLNRKFVKKSKVFTRKTKDTREE